MKNMVNAGTTLIGACLAGLATDGWWEVGFIVVGMALIVFHVDYSPSIGEKALRLLEAHYRFMRHLSHEIDREWRPMGGQENEAKRVIVAEIRDTIPAHVQEMLDREGQK